jgi:nucleoside-diphosphate-sugar epimerase
MKVLVTGASGAIGPRVVNVFEQNGCQVSAFSIDDPSPQMFSPNVEIIVGDVTDKDAVLCAMKGVDAVIHMAALLHVVDPPAGLREEFRRVNVGGTAAIVEAAIETGVKRIVLFSTIAVYGSENGQVFDECSPTKPETYYARSKLAAEQIVLNARKIDGEPLGTVLRLGAVYGARTKGNYVRMVHALARNRFIPIGNGLNRRTLVYDKDVAVAAVLALEHPAAAGRVYNVTDGTFHTMNEIISAICRSLGRKPPHFSLPVAPVRFAVNTLENGVRLFGCRSLVTSATIDKYTEDIAVEGARVQKELGFVPQYDLDNGWRETIREMRELGLL